MDQPQTLRALSNQANQQRESSDRRAALLYGLAEVHLKHREFAKARLALAEAIRLSPYQFLSYFAYGKLCHESKDYATAISYLARARSLNPFHEDVCYYLATAHFYLEHYQEALTDMVDALVRSGDLEKQEPSAYQQKIQLIAEKIAGFDRLKRNHLIKARQQKLKQLYDQHQGDMRAPLLSGASVSGVAELPLSDDERQRSLLLQRHLIFKHLRDEEMQELARISSIHSGAAAEFIYREGTVVEGLYILTQGTAQIIKSTPLGHCELANLQVGRFFAEEDLLWNDKHRTSAWITSKQCQWLKIERHGLQAMLKRDQKLALHCAWYFWKHLALMIRIAHEQLQRLIASPNTPGPTTYTTPATPSLTPKQILHYELAINQREREITAHELSRQEFNLIGQLSTEEVYNAGEYIFRETTPGEKLYIVVAGEVLIVKTMEGVGQEALAILRKGNVFGEMALIDQQNCSADAKAGSGGVTLMAIRKEALQEILSHPDSQATQFMTIIHKLLSQRLHEIREKIYQWKIMAGGF